MIREIQKIVETRRQNNRDRELVAHLGAIEFVRHQLPIDYDVKPEALASAGGYGHVGDRVNRQISENRFPPVTRRGRQTLSTARIQFGRVMSSDYARELILSSGLRLSGIVELLHWGMERQEQNHFPVVALGAVTRINKINCLVFIDGDPTSSQRDLLMIPYNRVWEANTRFLAVYSHS